MKIRIIGCGAMGSALAHALVKDHEVSLYDRKLEKAEKLAQECGAKAYSTPFENYNSDHLVLLAVKPQDLIETAKMLETLNTSLLVSVLAGVSIEKLKSLFPELPILRMMPNLAVKFGGGIVALINSPEILPRKAEIEKIFSPLGKLIWLDERKIDAFASLTACGPAFLFALVEGMIEAGLEMGFSKDAYPLTKDMLSSALLLLEKSDKLPAELKEEIAPPGGMTAAGLAVIEERNMAEHLTEAFIAAYKRAKELNP